MKRFFRLRVSRTTVISSTLAIAGLTRYVSDLVNFAPTKCAAQLVLKMLETIQAVDQNDETRILLIRRVVDVLLLIREHFDESGAIMPPNLSEKMQEFEFVLLDIHKKMKPAEKWSFFSRAMSKDKIKSDLAAHSATLDVAIGKLNLSLLLGVTVATQMSLSQNNRHLECTVRSTDLVLRDPDEEFLDRLGTLYDEFRISDVQLLPPDDGVQNSFVTFSDLSYALVKGEKRLIKSFDGDDEDQRKNWVREVKHWHKLKHPNVLQLQGISNRTSPYLYVIFQNAQARCLATYIVNALNNQDVPLIAATIVKMINCAVSAIKHVRKQLRVDEATSALAAEDATFALDPGNNLLLSINPLRPQGKGRLQVALRHTLQEMFWPPMESKNVPRYLTRLKATHDAPGIFNIRTSQTRTAVNAFLADYCALNESKGEHFLLPKSQSYRIEQPVFSASIDCGSEVKAGDYGVLVPGQEEDFSFRPYGNAGDDSPGIVCAVTETRLRDYTSAGLADVARDSPRVWRSDLNETQMNGFSNLKIHWYHLQNLTDIRQAARFLVNSVPLLQCIDTFEELVLVTKVTHVKEYRFSINDPDGGVQADDGPQTDYDAPHPLPFVYAMEPDSQEDELQFSQFPPRSHFQARSNEVWDARVNCRGKVRELKRIRYIQLRREDVIKRFGFVPAVRKSEHARHSAGSIIRSNPQRQTACREYESIERRSEPWGGMKAFLKEYSIAPRLVV